MRFAMFSRLPYVKRSISKTRWVRTWTKSVTMSSEGFLTSQNEGRPEEDFRTIKEAVKKIIEYIELYCNGVRLRPPPGRTISG